MNRNIKTRMAALARLVPAALIALAVLNACKKDDPAGITTEIDEWGDGPANAANALAFVIPTVEGTDTPILDNFILYKNKGTANELSAVYSYDAANKKWQADPAPFYIKDIAESDRFVATHTPGGTGDPVTGVIDKLETPPTAMTKVEGANVIALEFGHVNAQLEFRLTAADGINTAGAKIGIALEGQTFTALTAATEYLFTPTAAADKPMTVTTANGHVYDATIENFTLTAGKKTVVNVHLILSQATDITVQVADWGAEAEADTEAKVEVSVAPADLAALPGAGSILLYTGSGEGMRTGEYTWDGSALTVDTPLYWDDLAKGDHLFTLYYAPDAEGTPERDILFADAVIAWGEALDFGALNHLNAQLEFKLTADEGIELDGATIAIELGKNSYIDWVKDTEYVVLPAVVTDKAVAVTANGHVYNATIAELTLTAGKKTVVTIDLKLSQAAGISVQAAEWGAEVGASADAKVEVALTAADLAALPGAGAISISTGSLTGVYDWDGTALTTVTPIYWDDLAAGSHDFTFTFTPTADGTPEKDVLTATAAIGWGQALDFGALSHVNAQLEFKLTAETGIDITGATIAIALGENNYTAWAADMEYVVDPAAAAADKDVTVTTANGHVYNAVIGELILTADKKTVVTINLMRSQTAGISVQAAEWGVETAANTDAKVVVNLAAADLRALPGAGAITIATGSLTGVYNWDGAVLITDTPIYWDDLAKGNHNFTFTFTPTAAGTPDKDILTATATIGWGEALDFGALAHVNAQLTVVLSMGAGYGVDEWDALTKTLTLNGFSTPAYVMANGKAIVAPTTLGDNHTVTLTIAGHTYTMKLAPVFSSVLAGGKQYTLTATVNKTGIGGISIDTITDWAPGSSGTGEFEY